MSTSPLLVTGASGKLGRRVIEILLEAKAGPLIATTRTPASLADLAARGVTVRAADFDDPASLPQAFQGVGRALLVSTDVLDLGGRRLVQHRRAVEALEAAGVEHVVYTSLPKPQDSPILIAADHAGTEKLLEASRLGYTVLRNNLYAEALFMTLPAALASGQLVDARSEGAVAYVSREDCARAAAAALADRAATARRTLDVTGPAALTSGELAALVSELFGRTVSHVQVPPAALIEGLLAHGLPEPMAALFASFDAGIARRDLAAVSGAVEQLTGRAPQGVREFLLTHRAALTGG